jgi:Zn-dependent protease with chaperone function
MFYVVLFTIIVFPALFVALHFFASFRLPPEDRELRARRRFAALRRGNTILFLAMIGGVLFVSLRPLTPFSPALKAVFSVLMVIVPFFVYSAVVGIIDRRIRNITYALRGYLAFQAFIFFGRFFGVLLLIVFFHLPLFTDNVRGLTGVITIVSGVLLFIIITLFQMKIIGRIFGVLAPLNDKTLVSAIQELAEKANAKKVTCFTFDTFGYPYYNAYAAPGKTIYFTTPLLGVLTGEEILAIAAHEIGHIATAKKRAFHFMLILVLLLIVVSLLAFIIPSLLGGELTYFLLLIAVMVLLILFISAIAKRRQRFEKEADAVSATLMDDPEHLIGALEKIYALNMVPRRFDKKGTEKMSHPSLERRVASLRGEEMAPPKKRPIRVIIFLGIVVLLIIYILFSLGLFPYRNRQESFQPWGGASRYEGEERVVSLPIS